MESGFLETALTGFSDQASIEERRTPPVTEYGGCQGSLIVCDPPLTRHSFPTCEEIGGISE